MITLSKSGNTVTFTFDENSGYLQNGTIDVPVNSLSLILDESDMATFRKSASNDIFISARYEEFGMSKAELEAWYKANMVGSSGGGTTPEEVQTMIDESVSGKAESVSAVSSAEYVSSSTTINFKNVDGDVISSIDASDFVVDGMIDDVRIETISGVTYLVIDFNTASGKEDIQIPLTDIFDPSNYYTKQEVDASLSGKADTTAVTQSISESVSGKVDTSTYTAYTATTSTVLSGKQDTLTAGRAIDITSNVVSLDLPISAGTGVDSILMGGSGNTASGDFSVAYGKLNSVSGECSTASGNRNTSNNFAEASFGQKNVSRTEDASAFGHSGNTLFSVGNGIINAEQGIDANHNAFEVRGNGDIYIADTNSSGSYYEKQMIKLQDALGGGGGKAISAGTNISVTTGETADTVSCTLPITINNNKTVVLPNNANNTANGSYGFVGGRYCQITNYAGGAYPDYAFCHGYYNTVTTESEAAFGKFNQTKNASGAQGISGTSIFTIGNGDWTNRRHNALEVMHNGDIYIADTNDTSTSNYYEKPMIKLQDHLGGGSITIDPSLDSGSTNAVANSAITSGITAVDNKLGGMSLVKLTQSEYDALVSGGTVDADTLYVIVSGSTPTPTPTGWTLYSAGSLPLGDFTNLRISQSVASGLSEDENFQISYYEEDTGIGWTWTIGNVCSQSDCTEYCCQDYDPETGECIDWSPDCCAEECIAHDNGYIFDDYSGFPYFVPFTYSDGYWTLNQSVAPSFNFSAQVPFDIELMA